MRVLMHRIPLFFNLFLFVVLASCSTNQATGERQFTGLMPAGQEKAIGAEEHPKILAQFGEYKDAEVQHYVDQIGQRLAQYTERDGVQYTFTVLDSPEVNAFAVPGGYVYVTRGLMALANDEAELASVIGHEIGHITGRHSAQQYSKGVLASLGATAISLAVDVPGLDSALGLGSDLYLKSYSRQHEHQADELGIRYLSKAGYDEAASTDFLKQLQRYSQLQAQKTGQAEAPYAYFSTHPLTSDRIAQTNSIRANYQAGGEQDKVNYFKMIDDMPYGESPSQGFIRGQEFIHTELGFKFAFPQGYEIINQPARVIGKNGDRLIVFDGARRVPGEDIANYLVNDWKKGDVDATAVERIMIDGMHAAALGRRVSSSSGQQYVQEIAIAFDDTQVYRFSILMPYRTTSDQMNEIKRTTYSFEKLNAAEKARYKPRRIKVFAAKSGDSIAEIANRMPIEGYKLETFRVLNGLEPNEGLVANRMYKTIVE